VVFPLTADPQGILALPEGFSYKLLARSGQTPTAEGVHPSDPDGIGVFEGPDGGSVLICNHEDGGSGPYPVPVVEGITYDPDAKGGTSTISVDADGNRIGQYTSVTGTNNNCAGGISPGAPGLPARRPKRAPVPDQHQGPWLRL
jgi:secreted PhoX family phosphatase